MSMYAETRLLLAGVPCSKAVFCVPYPFNPFQVRSSPGAKLELAGVTREQRLYQGLGYQGMFDLAEGTANIRQARDTQPWT